MIAYEADAAFVNNPLMKAVREDNRIGKLQTALEAIFADKRVILAMCHDLAPPNSEALWNGRPSTPLVVTGKLAVVKRLMGWGYRTLMLGCAAWSLGLLALGVWHLQPESAELSDDSDA